MTRLNMKRVETDDCGKYPFPTPWRISERRATPEAIFRRRRQILKAAGFLGFGLAAGASWACGRLKNAAIVGAQETAAGA